MSILKSSQTPLVLFSLLLLSISPRAHAEIWDVQNDPAPFDVNHNFDYTFSHLPLSAALKTTPWSETYWPSYRGSINIRWNTVDQDGFKYVPPTLAEAKAMTLDQLKQLSPSEKYDLFLGHYTYPLWTEVKEYADPAAGQYTGLCDGWSIAAVQYAEPRPVTLSNPDGIAIPFGSSDVKALMTFAAEFHFRRQTVQTGHVCTTSTPTTPDELADCSGMNPGAMHVILANDIGLNQSAFITERQPDNEDWNLPVYAYETTVTGSAVSTVPGAHGVQVHTVLHYTEDLDKSYFDLVVGTPNFHSNRIKMDYILDLDANDQIVGGSWVAGSDRPGYFWLPTNHLDFTGNLQGINQIYQSAH